MIASGHRTDAAGLLDRQMAQIVGDHLQLVVDPDDAVTMTQ